MSRFMRNRILVLAVIAVLLLAVLPIIIPGFWLPVFITFFLYSCWALGWNVVMGYAGQLSLVQTLFVGAGVYVPGLLFMHYRLSPWIGMWGGAALAVGIGAFLGFLCFRYKVKGVYFALASISLSQIGVAFVLTFKELGGGQEIFWPKTWEILDFQFRTNTPYYYVGLILLIGIMLVTYILKGTKLGYYFMALRDNEEAAQSLGVQAVKFKTYAVMLSGALTAIAGTFWGQYLGMASAREQMGVGVLVIIILCAQLGGMGTVLGPVLGAALVVVLSTGVRWYMTLPPGITVAIYSGILVLAIIFLPKGIIGLFPQRLIGMNRMVSIKKDSIDAARPASNPNPPKPKGETLLKVDNASINFGGLMAVSNFSLEVKQGEIVGLIGPNGAGKTTAFNLMTGFFEPTGGEITFEGNRLNGMRPDQIARLGLVRTFQIVHPFPDLSTAENVMLGAFLHHGKTHEAEEKAMNALKTVGMAHRANTLARELTLAEQRRLEIARVLATQPKLILLDEAMAGLTPTEIHEAIELIQKLRNSGITFLIVEHVMPIIMNLAERIVVMNLGAKMAEGTPEEVSKNQQVIDAYLGEEALLA